MGQSISVSRPKRVLEALCEYLKAPFLESEDKIEHATDSNIYLASALATVAYCQEEDIRNKLMSYIPSSENGSLVFKKRVVEGADSFDIYFRGSEEVWVAIKGTNNPVGWAYNWNDFWMTEDYDATNKKIQTIFEREKSNIQDRMLYLCGHSRGGYLACRFGSLYETLVTAIFTFGQPILKINDNLSKKLCRVYRELDLVPHVRLGNNGNISKCGYKVEYNSFLPNLISFHAIPYIKNCAITNHDFEWYRLEAFYKNQFQPADVSMSQDTNRVTPEELFQGKVSLLDRKTTSKL